MRDLRAVIHGITTAVLCGMAVFSCSTTGYRHHIPQGKGRRDVQHRGIQRVEEHRHRKGAHPHGGPSAGKPRRIFGRPDHVCLRPKGARPAICHRLAKTPERTGMGAFAAVRRGDRADSEVVPRKPSVARKYLLRKVPRVLR